MGNRVPSWVYKREQAISDISHTNYERQLEDKIRQLEKENSELKNKLAKFEDAFFIAIDLLMKKL